MLTYEIKRLASHLQDDISELIHQFEKESGVAVTGLIAIPNEGEFEVDIEIKAIITRNRQ